MIKHIVLFKFKEDLGVEAIADVMNGFASLQSQIPEILSFRWGFNNSPEGLDKGFKVGFEMELADGRARSRYLAHPAHVAFAQNTVLPALHDGLESVVVFDYTLPSP